MLLDNGLGQHSIPSFQGFGDSHVLLHGRPHAIEPIQYQVPDAEALGQQAPQGIGQEFVVGGLVKQFVELLVDGQSVSAVLSSRSTRSSMAASWASVTRSAARRAHRPSRTTRISNIFCRSVMLMSATNIPRRGATLTRPSAANLCRASQGLADGRAAQLEILHQGLFVNSCSGSKLQGDDLVPDELVGLVTKSHQFSPLPSEGGLVCERHPVCGASNVPQVYYKYTWNTFTV